MTGRGGRRGRRGGRSHSNHDPQSSSDSDTEPRAKMPKEEATVKEVSYLLSQPREILIQIVNYLDPKSFKELALSCKAFFHFCLNTRGIAIVSPIKRPELALNNGSINFFNSRCRICCRKNGSYKKHLKTLNKWPFVISIGTFYVNILADRLEEVKQVLQANGVKKIGRLDHEYTPTTVQQLAVITNFLRAFDVKTIGFRGRGQGDLADDVINGILNMPLNINPLNFSIMAGRGGRRGRGGARGGRGGTNSNLNLQMNYPNGDGEPSAKKAKEEAAAEEFSDLITQPGEILVQIVNHLEPEDFQRLAYTCKYLYNFCLNSRGIRVIFPMKKVYANKCTRVRTEYLHTCCHCGNFKRNNFEEYLKRLRKWHFAIHIEEFNLYGGGPLLMKALKRDVKNLLERNGVKKICCMTVDPSPKTVREVEDFITQYVKAFDIEHLKVEYDEEEPADILKETIEALVKMEVASLGVSSEYGLLQGFSFESVLNCAIPTLDVNAAIGEGDIDKIVQIWKTKNLKNWSFSYSFDSNEIINYFDSYGIRSFNYNGPIDPRNPPVFMETRARGRTTTAAFSIYFLRADGKIVSITIGLVKDDGAFPIVFRMCPIDEAPTALRNIHV